MSALIHWFCRAHQVKSLARDIYEQYFKVAQSVPRGIVAKLFNIASHLDSACKKHSNQVFSRNTIQILSLLDFSQIQIHVLSK